MTEAIRLVPVEFDPFAPTSGPAIAVTAPTTEPQRELWTAARFGDDANLAYNESVTLRLHGELDARALSAAVTSFDLTLKNSKRRRDVVGSLYNADDASGAFRAEVKLSMYYNSNVIRTKILARTPSSFSTRLVDATAPVNSRAYVVDLPWIIYNGGANVGVPGIDTDRTLDPTFTAHAHSVLGYSCSIQRLEEYYP